MDTHARRIAINPADKQAAAVINSIDTFRELLAKLWAKLPEEYHETIEALISDTNAGIDAFQAARRRLNEIALARRAAA